MKIKPRFGKGLLDFIKDLPNLGIIAFLKTATGVQFKYKMMKYRESSLCILDFLCA